MNLKNTLAEAMKNAMRNKEKIRLSTIRMVLSAIKQQEIDNKIQLNDSDITTILTKLVKQRKESVKQFETAARHDLVEKEQEEIRVLSEFLPKALSDQELNKYIEETITSLNANSPKDMGKVMSVLKSKLAGRADMSIVSQKVKSKL